MSFHLSARSLSRMHGIDSRLISIAKRAIEITLIDFGIPPTGGMRSIDTQQALFNNRKSKCDGINKVSKHQLGLALDVYAYVDGVANWDKLNLALIAAAFFQAACEMGYRIEWGGLWSLQNPDMPHFQIVD